jgi:CRISPR-associated endonuclease Csn1
MKKVLGLDIGSNSIGFSLLELDENNDEIVFKELTSNSIIFSEPNTAEERRKGRSSRRRNERKSARNKKTRKIFVNYSIAKNEFIDNTTQYLNSLNIQDKDVYKLREKAVLGTSLSKEEFVYCTYSILTDRGYNNMFSISNEDGVINEAVTQNTKEYESKNYALPSMILTQRRKELEDKFQNIPIRNKKDDYSNSLDRNMHREEFINLVSSQADNKNIFISKDMAQNFIDEIIDESEVNTPFYQRTLKSFEGMVEYCSFYDEFHPNGSQKKMPLANIRNIERTLRQAIDNYGAKADAKTGEIKVFSEEEKNSIVDFWINRPSSNEIKATNIFISAGFKKLKLNIPEKSSQLVLDIKAHRQILEILNKYEIDFQNKENEFYNDILLELYYFKNNSSRVENIKKQIEKYNLTIEQEFVEELALLENMDGFASFSLKFTNEVLGVMKKESKTHHEALESLGYYSKYLKMPTYDYLPPLEPTKKDIKWLEENIQYFESKHLFYQPMMSPKVKRVISILRKLINEIIKKYGRIDEIRIETAKKMNSKVEQEKINENQAKDRAKNNRAVTFLKDNEIKKSPKNIQRAKLFLEQDCECLYSGENITKDEAFDENETEVEHFIPRSIIWINSYKNKILVKKKYNQNKGSAHPVEYLKSVGEWENFKGRVDKTKIAFNKKDWLTKEEIIESVMNKDKWLDSYLNDTRSATRTIQKYLNHYLYPKENIYGTSEDRHIFSISGRAISELKYMWGINKVMPKKEDDKKDRNTNYHHTLDAFSVALCSPRAINTLHSHLKKKENKYKSKALKEKLINSLPHSTKGINIVEHLRILVERYETNRLYVCPYNKRKTNMKGFKDGNLKLYVTNNPKDTTKKILAEMQKVSIDSSLLTKIVKGFPKPRNDDEVKKEIKSIQDRLDPLKQKKIINAIEIYADELLDIRAKKLAKESEINKLDKTKKNAKQHKEFNDGVNESIKSFSQEKKVLELQLKDLKCSFAVKNAKRQIVKSLKLYNPKISETNADAILFSSRKSKKIERLSLVNFQKALEDKEPFVIKVNESTLNVELFNTEKRGQAVGLNYFSSIANDVKVKINNKFMTELKDKKSDMVLYKNEIIKVNNIKENKQEYFIFNGGGDISLTSNRINIKNINLKKDETKKKSGDKVTPNKKTIISKVKIDFFGNITEV